jgi:hypothetical protein
MKVQESTFISTIALLALSLLPLLSAEITVPGTANPCLAGMPDGSTSDGDSAPAESPVQAPSLLLSDDAALIFTVSGGVGATPTRRPASPDGGNLGGLPGLVSHRAGADNGIAALTAPVESLVGVFIGPELPSLSPAPVALDFSSPSSRDAVVIRPLLKQVFFIGNGRALAGAPQLFVVPNGATRLFLGAMDGYAWNNNIGAFSVQLAQTNVNLVLATQSTAGVKVDAPVGVGVKGRWLTRDGRVWIPRGVGLGAFTYAPWYKNPDYGARLGFDGAAAKFGPSILHAAKTWGIDSIRFLYAAS